MLLVFGSCENIAPLITGLQEFGIPWGSCHPAAFKCKLCLKSAAGAIGKAIFQATLSEHTFHPLRRICEERVQLFFVFLVQVPSECTARLLEFEWSRSHTWYNHTNQQKNNHRNIADRNPTPRPHKPPPPGPIFGPSLSRGSQLVLSCP